MERASNPLNNGSIRGYVFEPREQPRARVDENDNALLARQ